MEQELRSNYAFIQSKIEEIKACKFIDIKQISDLQRYVNMQKDIIDSLFALNAGALK
jgi:hypothetical protein